ncbi:MAG: tetratricopeptide repeat protein [Crocinitomicaceae bacterium]|nr:tetratricopeptide repeat protein [Crocinitomicaceae bacterium]
MKKIGIIMLVVLCSASAHAQNERDSIQKLLDQLTAIIENDRNSGEEYYNRGVLYRMLGDTNSAIEDYNKSLQLNVLDETRFSTFVNRGVLHQGRKSYELALNDYNSALEMQPENEIALNNRGYLFMDLNDTEKAKADFRMAITMNKLYTSAYQNLIVVLDQEQKYEQALAVCNLLVEAIPEDPRSYSTRADHHYLLGDTKSALEDWDTGVELSGNDPEWLMERAQIKHEVLGDELGAIEDFSKAIAKDPTNGWYYFMRCRPYYDLHDFTAVIKNCDLAIRFDSTLAEAYIMRSNIFDHFGAPKEAQEGFKKAIEINPNLPEGYLELAISHFMQGELETATRTLDAYLVIDPNYAPFYSLKGDIYRRQENHEAAIEWYTKHIEATDVSEINHLQSYYGRAISRDSTGLIEKACEDASFAMLMGHPDAHLYVLENCLEIIDPHLSSIVSNFQKAVESENVGKYNEAIEIYTELIEIAPDSLIFYYNRGKAFRKLERHEEAIADYLRALEIDPTNVECLVSYSVSEGYLGNLEKSKELLELAIESDPTYPMSYQNMGALYAELGDYETAIIYLKKAIYYNDDYVMAWASLAECYVQLERFPEACEVYKLLEERGMDSAFGKRVKYCNR